MFYDNLVELCKNKNTTVTALLSEFNLSTSKGTAWKSGSIPKYDMLKKLAAYFSIPVYLLFKEENDKVDSVSLTKDKQKVLEYYERLEEEDRDYIKGEMVKLFKNKSDSKSEFAKELA